jgi:hypothetical protein
MLFALCKNPLVKVFLCFVVLMSALYLLQSDLYLKYEEMLFSDTSGIAPRYSGQTVFEDNFNCLYQNIFGIGFNIADNFELRYTDCGYIVYLTMGNLIFVFGVYYLLYVFLRNNLNLQQKRYIFVVIMLFEFALPAIIYIKFYFAIIFVICYLRSLNSISKTDCACTAESNINR